jgi:hypothetical protein
MASSAALIPARYAKFIAAVLGEAVAYVQVYGTAWHLQAALVMAGAALAVLGVPNAAPAAPTVPAMPPASSSVKVMPPAP